MIIFRFYDKEEKIDYVWYQSSNILFSKCEDHENALKTLTVVFSNGSTYKYKNVNVNDYVLFVHGGIMGSNGKAFNIHIRKKGYEFEKLPPTSTEELEKLKMEKRLKAVETETETKEDEGIEKEGE